MRDAPTESNKAASAGDMGQRKPAVTKNAPKAWSKEEFGLLVEQSSLEKDAVMRDAPTNLAINKEASALDMGQLVKPAVMKDVLTKCSEAEAFA